MDVNVEQVPGQNNIKLVQPAPTFFDKALKAIQQVGFPIVVSAALLYMMYITGNETVAQLKVTNEKLTQIDQKLSTLLYAKGASNK